MRRKAVSIVELSIGIALLVLLASQVSLSTNLYTQTPKREAERLAKKLSSLMLKADKIQAAFQINIETDKMTLRWNTNETSTFTQADRDKFTEEFPASTGCTYSWNTNGAVRIYSHVTNKFNAGATIAVRGKGDTYYVIIATNGSRVRVSDTPPED